MRSTPLPPVRLLDLFGPFRVAGVEREIAAEFLEPRPALRVGRGADHQRRAHQFADLHAHKADAGTCALDQQSFATLEPPRGHDCIVHRLQRDRKTRRLLIGHVVGGNAMHPAPVGHGVLGEAARRRRHDAVAGFEVLHLAADRLDLAGAFETEP